MKKNVLIFLICIFLIKFSKGQIQCISCYEQNTALTSGVNNLLLNGGLENGCADFAFFCPTSLSYSCDITSWTCLGGGDSTYANMIAGGSTLHVEGNQAAYFGNSYCKACSLAANDTSCLSTSSCTVSGVPKGYPKSGSHYGDSDGVSLQQTVNGLATGNVYVLEFWAGGEWGYKNKGLFAVDVGFGNTMLKCNPTEAGKDIGTRYVIKFAATSTTHTIKFTNWGHLCSTCTELVLDDVKLYTVSEFPDSLAYKAFSQTITKCAPDSIKVGIHTYSKTGIYVDTVNSNSDCTSLIINTNLTILRRDTVTQKTHLCKGQHLAVGIHTYTTSGIYYDAFKKANGCDSVVRSELSINVLDPITSVHVVICSNHPYQLPSGSFVTIPGTYYDLFKTASGCDSIIITEIVVNQPTMNTVNATIPCGQNYTLPSGTLVSSPGTYTETFTTSKGCDSVISIVLTPDVFSLDLAILIPNAFSPNQDGMNDELCIPANRCIEKINLIIYDRWGKQVFETNSMSKCWDGTYKGQQLEPAVFAYYFTIEYNGGTKAEHKGNISLIN